MKTNKTLASNFQKINLATKNYGCDWGRATDKDLDWWAKAEEWLKFAFLGSFKSFSEKDRKVFKELIETDVKT